MTVTFKAVNEDRLFRLISNFFARPSGVLYEIAQNSCRANSRRLEITLEGNVLTATDDGDGTCDAASLLTLAESEWDADVACQQPAGWGMFYLYSIADNVVMRSLFGSLTLDCNRFLNDIAYRGQAPGLVDPSDRLDRGFEIRASLKPEVVGGVLSADLRHFPIDIRLNGRAVEKADLEVIYGVGNCIRTTYQGNRVWVRLPLHFPADPGSFPGKIDTFWYGIPIQARSWHNDIAIEVLRGSPLTPVLPYRQGVKVDEKLEEFHSFVRKLIADHCTEQITERGNEESSSADVLCFMKPLEQVATQEELDSLSLFYVTEEEPYDRSGGSQGNAIRHRIVGRGETLVSESLDLTGISEPGILDEAEIFLPQGTVTRVDLPSRCPSWLSQQVVERTVTITVSGAVQKHSGYYCWHEAELACEKDLKVLAIVSGSGDGDVYFSDSPSHFWAVSDSVFEGVEHYDDINADSYETQKDNFERHIQDDIAVITNCFSLRELLGGLEIAGIKHNNVKKIAVKGKRVILTLKRGGQKVLQLTE